VKTVVVKSDRWWTQSENGLIVTILWYAWESTFLSCEWLFYWKHSVLGCCLLFWTD